MWNKCQVATVIAVYAPLEPALDVLKFLIPCALSGKAWDNLLENKLMMSFEKKRREAQWASPMNSSWSFSPPETSTLFHEKRQAERRVLHRLTTCKYVLVMCFLFLYDENCETCTH
ncbi:hypothetical protein QQ045_012448 [Rhodiola kirilowii]